MECESILSRRLSRRTLLGYGAVAGIGAAASLLVACGGSDDDSNDAAATSAPGGGASPTAAQSGGSDGEPKQGGTLVWGMGGDADALDPATSNAWACWRQVTMMYEALVRKDLSITSGTPGIVPLLAEKWEASPDAKEWTFNLRQGVKFHDGTDFNSDAVKANYERLVVPDSKYYYSGSWHGLVPFHYTTAVDTPDPYTVKFTMSQGVGEFLAEIGDYYGFGIASPTQILKVGTENLAANPSGTGPFTFVERVAGDHSTFARNDNYWGEKAHVDKLIVRPILEDQARVVALQTGEIDIMSDPPPDVIQSLVDSGYVLSEGEASQVAYYRFHFKNEHASNQKVRQAVSYAINRESIANDLFGGHVIPGWGLLTPGSPAYDPNWKPHPYDPDKAKQLLSEAGFADGFKTKILAAPTASGWPLAGKVAEFIKSNLADIGIDAELELTEWVTYLGINFTERTDALMWGTAWGMPTHFFLNIEGESTYNSETATGCQFYNTTEHPKEDIDSILKAGAQEPDMQKQIELYQQANAKMCAEDMAFLALNHDKMPHILKTTVKGFVHSVNVNYDMSKVWLDQ